jgi:hypothetical protein
MAGDARSIRGRVAVLKWAYFNAAAVEGYAVTKDAQKRWTATGAFVPGAVDAFKLAQRPLYFVAPFKGGAWRWEVKSLALLDGGRFAADLDNDDRGGQWHRASDDLNRNDP